MASLPPTASIIKSSACQYQARWFEFDIPVNNHDGQMIHPDSKVAMGLKCSRFPAGRKESGERSLIQDDCPQ